ncbi:MAG: aldo/keto reductase [Anaerolineaceae bacterium]|nr:aldo/keto reductase [Anaerolineaceae bacterium]
MKEIYLGKTGVKVSSLCLGSMQFGWTVGEQDAYKILDSAYQSGIKFLDTADIYSNWVAGNDGGVAEEIIGNWIKKNQVPRDQLIIATKVRGKMGSGLNDEGLSRNHIIQAVEASLSRLNTDYIDLYQMHWFDSHTPIEVTLSVLDDLVRQGKVRYVGCSNYPAWRLMQAMWTSDKMQSVRFDTLQPHYSLANRAEFERELAEVCFEYELGVLPYSPLAGGFLTGKYRQGQTDLASARQRSASKYFNSKGWRLLDAIDEILLNRSGDSASQIALAWLLHQPEVTSPIIGPRTLEQLKDNLGSVEVSLSDDELALLDDVSCWKA